MIKTFVLYLLLLPLFSYSTAPQMDKVHSLYQRAASEEKACTELIKLLSSYSQNSPLLLGYEASANMLLADHVVNPLTKLEKFNRGKEMLNTAITIEPDNVELRVLRFMAQKNAPFFLGYNDSIEEDKKAIFDRFHKSKNAQLKDYLLSILENSASLDEKELMLLRNNTELYK